LRRVAAICAIAAASRPHNVVVAPLRASTAANAVPHDPAPSTATAGLSPMVDTQAPDTPLRRAQVKPSAHCGEIAAGGAHVVIARCG